jgi:hypothetical protein
MTRLIVSTYDDNGTAKFGLFYDDSRDLYQEDWKPVLFDSEDEAKKKLTALESERYREIAAIPFSLEEAQKYAESHYWKFASTYAKSAPHEYCVKKWLASEDQLLYERFVATMRKYSVVGYFYGHKNDYLLLGDHYYWFMPVPDNLAVDLINRTTMDYLEFRDGAYYYKVE